MSRPCRLSGFWPRALAALALVAASAALGGRPAHAAGPAVQIVVTPQGAPVAEVVAAVRRTGGTVQTTAGGTVQALVPRAAVPALSADAAVADVERPAVAAADEVVGQGLTRIGADVLRRAGRSGAGVRIAVLDQAFGAPATLDALTGTELPPSGRQHRRSFDQTYGIAGRDFNGDPSRHGELVTEILYDIAPDADYTLVNYRTSVEFGQAVDWIVGSLKPDIVVHANSFLFGPFDGTGWFARQVDRAAGAGILWVNSVGNYRLRHWEGAWTDADGDGSLDVPGHGDTIPLALTASDRPACDLSWAGASVANAADGYQMALFTDSAGTQPALDAAGAPLVSTFATSPEPRVEIGPTAVPAAETLYLRITRVGNPPPDHLTLFCRTDLPPDVDVPASSVPTPGDARGALSIGAYHHASFALMDYSSEGPTDDGRMKPDLVAPSHVSTSGGFFGGTSSAAPHAAAAAALIWTDTAAVGGPGTVAQRVADQIRSLARDAGDPGPDMRSGVGYLRLDTRPPTIDAAAAATSVAGADLVLRLPVSDDGTIERVRLTVDGTPRAGIAFDGTAVVVQTNMRAEAEGVHTAGIDVVDRSGNAAHVDVPVIVDHTAPVLSVPVPGVALAGAQVAVPLRASDRRSGLRAAPEILYGDGTRGLGRFVHRYLVPGRRVVSVLAVDRAGNAVDLRRALRIVEFVAAPARRGRPAVVVTLARTDRVSVALRVRRKLVHLTRTLRPGRRRIVLAGLPRGRYAVVLRARGTRVVVPLVVRVAPRRR